MAVSGGMDGTSPVVHHPAAGADLRVLLRERDADGSLGAVEMVLPAGAAGPPLHLHPGHAESFYVLGGEPTLRLGDHLVTGGPGTWGTAPKGTPHTLANFGVTPARLLCLFSPAGFERRFERMLADPELASSLAELHEHERATRLLGPPLAPPRDPRPT